MAVERNLIMSLLKLTKDGPILVEDVNKESKIASAIVSNLLRKLQNEGMVNLKLDTVEADSDSRLKLAVKAASLGADSESISSSLCWQEFEEIAARAMRNNGYTTAKNVRF